MSIPCPPPEVAVPVRAAVCGLFSALSVIVRVPVMVPVMVGAKLMLMVQLPLAAIVLPQVFVCVNPEVTAILLTVILKGLLFEAVMVCAALVVPTCCDPKVRVVGDKVIFAAACEDRNTRLARIRTA